MPGQTAYWEFLVPNDGYYRISLRVRQNVSRDASSFRRVRLNGVLPYHELNMVEFKYDRDWYTQNITDASGENIYIFLKAGFNTLSLEAVGGFSPLELDFIEIATVHEAFTVIEDSFYDKLLFNYILFVTSYIKNITFEVSSPTPVEVWVDADIETLSVLERFARQYPKHIKFSFIDGSLLAAALAGNPPDAALFVGERETKKLSERGLISEYGDGWVLFMNKRDFYKEEAAREFLEWFNSEQVQNNFNKKLTAAKGVF